MEKPVLLINIFDEYNILLLSRFFFFFDEYNIILYIEDFVLVDVKIMVFWWGFFNEYKRIVFLYVFWAI